MTFFRVIPNFGQADKLQTLIKAAKVEDVEPIWTTLFAKVLDIERHKLSGKVLIIIQALEGKDVKDLLLNVGSGGGAAAAPAAGGAAASGEAPAEEKKEEKEEGKIKVEFETITSSLMHSRYREGRVGRRHGLWTVRLSSYRDQLIADITTHYISKLPPSCVSNRL